MREKITQRSIDGARSRARRESRSLYVWDTELRGFGLYVSATGEVSWLVQKWIGGRGGKAIRYVIDRSPRLPLEEARRQAQIEIGELQKGIDIVARRRKQRSTINAEINGAQLQEAFAKYVARNSTKNRYWSEIERIMQTQVMPQLGEKTLLSAISKQQIRALVEQKEEQGNQGAARSLFATLRPFFKWRVERDLISTSPMDELTAPKPTEARDRVLTKAEIRSIWSATEELGYPFGSYFRMLLLTGQRREEVAAMRFTELNLETSTWTIPGARTKNNREHIVHLNDVSLDILSRINQGESDFVFSTTGGSSISGYSKAKIKLDDLMKKSLGDKFKPWRTHDLRRTLVSGLAELGIATDVADRILNHVSGSSREGVKGVYQRYDFLEERKQALDVWGNFIRELNSPSPNPE